MSRWQVLYCTPPAHITWDLVHRTNILPCLFSSVLFVNSFICFLFEWLVHNLKMIIEIKQTEFSACCLTLKSYQELLFKYNLSFSIMWIWSSDPLLQVFGCILWCTVDQSVNVWHVHSHCDRKSAACCRAARRVGIFRSVNGGLCHFLKSFMVASSKYSDGKICNYWHMLSKNGLASHHQDFSQLCSTFSRMKTYYKTHEIQTQDFIKGLTFFINAANF